MPSSQLTFARGMGVEVKRGDPSESEPGKAIVVPRDFGQVRIQDWDLDALRRAYLKNTIKAVGDYSLTDSDYEFLAEDCNTDVDFVKQACLETAC